MDVLYFAYGSNLCTPRLQRRVPGVRVSGRAFLRGYDLRWHKRSVDGSGKCTVVPSEHPEAVVHGVLFQIPANEKPFLDQAEGLGAGYDEAKIAVETDHGVSAAVTYVASSTYLDESLRPYSWYRDLVVAGAEAHGVPTAYVAELRLVVATEDLDSTRDEENRVALPCSPGGRSMHAPSGPFVGFERLVVETLAGPHLEADQLAGVLESAEFVSLEHTGAGYFLTVRHATLPEDRIVCNDPLLIGSSLGVECGFVLFIDDSQRLVRRFP